ncbi:MAG: LegC family aminotransferase [Chromatiales bacterium]|nr:LegC family aminotransferase [Chromatiales bacterium]
MDDILARLRGCLPQGEGPWPLHEPSFQGHEWAYVKDCLDSGWVSSVGAYVDRFESALSSYTGVAHAVATVNGTAALHIALLVAGVEPGDEVLVPALTFVATSNAIRYCQATPHFIAADESDLGPDPQALDAYLREILVEIDGQACNAFTGKPLRALVAMHSFGHPNRLDALAEICSRYGLTLVEDAAEALGTRYQGLHVGHWGRVAALSFNGNKIITTGGGGAVLTNDQDLARRARHLATTAKVAGHRELFHDETGFNYRMPNLNAALGLAQMEALNDLLRRKRMLAQRYQEAFVDCSDARFVEEPPDADSNYWLNTLLVGEGVRDALLDRAEKLGIQARPAWTLQHRLPMYRYCPSMEMTATERLAARIVNLPSSPNLVGED